MSVALGEGGDVSVMFFFFCKRMRPVSVESISRFVLIDG
jgi:hypothetical protein